MVHHQFKHLLAIKQPPNSISVYQKNNEEQDYRGESSVNNFENLAIVLSSCRTFKGPDYEDEPFLAQTELQRTISLPLPLKQHLIATKSLFYSHFGKYSGRHFTFYLNKEKILRSTSFLWENARKRISDWHRFIGQHDFVIIRPESGKDPNTALDPCIEYLRNSFNLSSRTIVWNTDKPRNIQSNSNIVFLDFGTLTGESINKFLSYVKNADHILICIFFNQYQNRDFEFYKKIQDLRVDVSASRKEQSVEQTELFPTELKVPTKDVAIYKTCTVKIIDLYNFPFSYYNSATCPICEHERALDAFRIQTPYMDQFTNDRKNRLRIRSSTDMGDHPSDFYLDSSDTAYELSSESIMKMYELKQTFIKALGSTQYRIQVYLLLYRIHSQIELQIRNLESDLYALLYLLSNEVNWFQREPLVFRQVREIVSELAEKVAVMSVDDLIDQFQDLRDASSSKLRMAIRYKYCAITVLRSSHKFKFCQNIGLMIEASQTDGRFSNNLLQNIFYHIGSLHKNGYNKSINYFKGIDSGFRSLDGKSLALSIEQNSLLKIINVKNTKRIKRIIRTSETANDIDIIRQLKSEILGEYDKTRHPKPAKHFHALDFRKLGINGDALIDFIANQYSSEYFNDFQSKQNVVLSDWHYAYKFIEEDLIEILERLSPNILESDLFRRLEGELTKYEDVKRTLN